VRKQFLRAILLRLGSFHTRLLLSSAVEIGAGQKAVIVYGWESNRGSDIALAMRHRLK